MIPTIVLYFSNLFHAFNSISIGNQHFLSSSRPHGNELTTSKSKYYIESIHGHK